jgi:hypothetical protein
VRNSLNLIGSLCLVALLSPVLLQAQSVDFGIKVGSQRTDPIMTSAPYSDVPFRKIVGGVIEASLPATLAVEVSAFKQDPTYHLPPTTVFFPQPNIQIEERLSNTTVHFWEVPLVAKKYFTVANRTRVFADLGINLLHTSGNTRVRITQFLVKTIGPPAGPPLVNVIVHDERPTALIRKWTQGWVVGGGVDVRVPLIHVRPELRYTRWAHEPLASDNGTVRSNRNNFEVLVGFVFTLPCRACWRR